MKNNPFSLDGPDSHMGRESGQILIIISSNGGKWLPFFGMLFRERGVSFIITDTILPRTHPNLCSHLLHQMRCC